MRYIVIHDNNPTPVYTNWFDEENNYEEGMVVIDLWNHVYFDGKKWTEIEEDNL